MSDAIKALAEAVRGRVITPSDSDYDDARAVYNAMHDRKPRAVIQCVDSADVMAAVTVGRDGGLDLAIRGGGHSVPGFGTVDDGLVIDLLRMNSVRVDPLKKIARVGGGATWGDVDHATYPFGLAAPGGIIDGGWRPDAGRRHRLPDPRRRSLHRQPAGGRCRSRR
jgi:FAD/FMN-containing dehydrogenase